MAKFCYFLSCLRPVGGWLSLLGTAFLVNFTLLTYFEVHEFAVWGFSLLIGLMWPSYFDEQKWHKRY